MNTNEEDSNVATLTPPKPKPLNVPEPSHESWGDDEDEATGFKKWGPPLIVGILAIVGIGFGVKVFSKGDNGPVRKQETTYVQMVLPPAPPPPPPPPPPPEAMKEEKMIEEEKEEEAPPDAAPAAATAIKGPSTGGMAIQAANRGGVFSGRKSGPTERMKWSAYANQTGSRISQALRDSPRTRSAKLEIVVRVWVDLTGRITRAKLDTSSGDAGIDAAIRDEIITGMQLSQPPPDGMAMPINMKVTGRRPN